jgi:hypothetical protein
MLFCSILGYGMCIFMQYSNVMYSIDTVTSLFTEEQLGPDLNDRICIVNTVDVTFRNIKV